MKMLFGWPTLGNRQNKQKELDVVCGMQVDPAATGHFVYHAGTTYYFCTTHCRQQFEKTPEQFAGVSM